MLDRKTPPGKTSYLTNEQQAELKHLILNSTPAEQGMGMYASWDTRIVQTFLKEKYGVFMTRVSILKMLRRLDLRYPRPTYTLVKGDEKKQKAFLQEDMINNERYGAPVCR